MADTPSIDPKLKQQQAVEVPAQKPLPEPAPQKEQEAAPPQKEQFRFFKGHEEGQARKLAQMPTEIGHKIQPGKKPYESPVLQKPQKPITPDHYKRLSQEAVIRQKNFRETPLYHHIVEKSFPQKDKNTPWLSRTQLANLIRLRHIVSDKPNMRDVIRHEIGRSRADESRGLAQKSRADGAASGAKQSGKSATRTAGESAFEGTLKQLRATGKMPVSQLPGGSKGRFAPKSEAGWRSFFGNVVNLGSSEQPVARRLANFMEGLFRGLYRTAASAAGRNGAVLVSDLRFSEGGRVVSDRFARLLIQNPDLLSAFEQLNPGETFTPETGGLNSSFGEELQYTRLVHTAAQAPSGSDETAQKSALSQLKNQSNPLAMARLEQSLINERNKRLRTPPFWAGSKKEEDTKMPSFFFGWGWQTKEERERKAGKPRLWVFLSYAISAIVAAIVAYAVFRSFN